jgi:hypothetical protein
MRPLGYLYKRVATRPEWLKAPHVSDIYSLSACVSFDFTDYFSYWKHNGFWLFDSPAVIASLAAQYMIELEGLKLFYYEAYEQEFDRDTREWVHFEPESSIGMNVHSPSMKCLEGYDVTSFENHTSPECSPLSCNSFASTLSTNEHCLFKTFDDARDALENDGFEGSKAGPYRIIAVYSVIDAKLHDQ